MQMEAKQVTFSDYCGSVAVAVAATLVGLEEFLSLKFRGTYHL